MKRIVCILCALCLLLSGCTAAFHSTELTRSLAPSGRIGDTPEEFAAWQSDFALRLFTREAKPGTNVLISPLSVYMALALAADGAGGQTLAEMEALLGGDIAQIKAAVAAYLGSLTEDDALSVANSVWLHDGDQTVKQDYLQSAVDHFDASIFKAPFDDTTVSDINAWISEKTDGTVRKMLDGISPDTLLYLINALLFDAEWTEAYGERQQHDGVFRAANGESRTVTMMHSSESTYLRDGGTTGFLKYYKGHYAFAALLPPEGVSPEQYIATLSSEKLTAILEGAVTDAIVNATLPKFSVDYGTELSEVLRDGGIPTAFTPAADFSGIADGLLISRVLHKAHITVDAHGTKAGAATVVDLRATGMPTGGIYTVTLDRPFVYLIVDTSSHTPLFIGTLNDIT